MDEKELRKAINRNANNPQSSYKKKYDLIAYEILAEGKSKAHICRELHCAKTTLIKWMHAFPSFNAAVELGLAAGESEYMDMIDRNTEVPASGVNNGLIKLKGINVYGIKEEAPQVIVNNNSTNKSGEELMKERGIPIPQVGCTDDGDIADIEESEYEVLENGE